MYTLCKYGTASFLFIYQTEKYANSTRQTINCHKSYINLIFVHIFFFFVKSFLITLLLFICCLFNIFLLAPTLYLILRKVHVCFLLLTFLHENNSRVKLRTPCHFQKAKFCSFLKGEVFFFLRIGRKFY